MVQATPAHPISVRYLLLSSYRLRLGFPTGL